MSSNPYTTTVVYQFFNTDGQLLYVGATGNMLVRFYGHTSATPWYHEVATIKVQHFAERATALSVEAELIRTGCPLYNSQHSVTGPRAHTGAPGRPRGVEMEGERFRALLAERGVLIVEVAKATGIHRKTLANLAHDRGRTSRARAEAIAGFFDVPVKYLFPAVRGTSKFAAVPASSPAVERRLPGQDCTLLAGHDSQAGAA